MSLSNSCQVGRPGRRAQRPRVLVPTRSAAVHRGVGDDASMASRMHARRIRSRAVSAHEVIRDGHCCGSRQRDARAAGMNARGAGARFCWPPRVRVSAQCGGAGPSPSVPGRMSRSVGALARHARRRHACAARRCQGGVGEIYPWTSLFAGARARPWRSDKDLAVAP